ncbi:TIGR04150 pseudo-rSAM protein [Parabacteroides sp. OttesenSCG-928-G07]|nr:TIGR04150 pseudo-rSAM protein [Parabacteroides sp. OttesenSCG-928-G21]MDL2278132.1 TIGR04150 pseudo-rSAM protein [Parabacteroides sp. OttesenSCG-928-G07]
MKTVIDYWFAIEPYVFVGITSKFVLLYNTLDGVTIESDKSGVIELLQETLQKENCGVVLLTNERYQQKEIKDFIRELRCNYMGDIIDVTLSKGKPVQLLPFFNFPNEREIYKKHNFSSLKNVLKNLSEISIHVDIVTNVAALTIFLQSISGSPIFNVVGDIGKVPNCRELLSYLDQHLSPKIILCSYKDVIALQPTFWNNFSYRISVQFPLDKKLWDKSIQLLFNQTLPVEYVFEVSSEENCLQAEQLVEQFGIEKYQLKPVYTGENIGFFEENVFLTREDILSTPMSIKDFFSRQAMNIYDFGKINVMSNGDVYANLNYPVLGNIYTENIYEIVQREVDTGKSWFRIRNQAPCTDCVYQWLCPPPSDYEIAIGRPNLCHVK